MSVYSQDWSVASTVWSNNASYLVYDRPPDSVDPAYPNLRNTESLFRNATGGPGGVPCITITAAGGDYGFAGWFEAGFGPETDGYWNVAAGRVDVSVRHTVASLAETNNIAFWLPSSGGSPFGGFELRFIKSGSDHFFRILDDFALLEDSAPVNITGWSGNWVDFTYEWVGSTTGTGYFRISANGVQIVEFAGLTFIPFDDDGHGANIAPGYALGFAGLMGDHAALTLSTVGSSPAILTDESSTCCGSGAVEGGGVAAPGAGVDRPAVVDPGWDARVTGGGAVPLEADLTDGENWGDS